LSKLTTVMRIHQEDKGKAGGHPYKRRVREKGEDEHMCRKKTQNIVPRGNEGKKGGDFSRTGGVRKKKRKRCQEIPLTRDVSENIRR